MLSPAGVTESDGAVIGLRALRLPALALVAWLACSAWGAPASAAAVPTNAALLSPSAQPEQIAPGSQAVVRADGDCLRLRAEPGLSGERVTCLPEGSIVTVLPSSAEVDGLLWQLVEAAGTSGWAAAQYLQPATPQEVEAGTSCAGAASTARPGISGDLPAGGGMALAVWGGGTPAGVATAAAARGCPLASIWSTTSDGRFVGYVIGAPAIVNRPWMALVGDRIAAGTPLVLLCRSGGSAISIVGAGGLTPGAWGTAPVQATAAPAPETGALAAIVLDEASGAVLFEDNAHESLPIASLSKILTAIVAIEGNSLDARALSDVAASEMPGSTVMGLQRGDCFSVRDLLYGLMLPSGNDAARAIGRYQAGSEEGFVATMNLFLNRLGLQESSVADPHGLSPQNQASAADLALLTRYAMQNPDFAAIAAAGSWTASGNRTIQLYNINQFLTQYEGADGVKTGFTEQAGRTLVASATRDGHRLYVVLLNDDDRYGDAAALLDWAFENHQW